MLEMSFYFAAVGSWCVYQFICGEHENTAEQAQHRGKVLMLGGAAISLLYLLTILLKLFTLTE